MRRNIVREKSFDFAVQVVALARRLQADQKAFVLANQFLKSGTAIGALVREAEHAESKADFIHKNAIAQKETNETIYWLELLHACELIQTSVYQDLHQKATELLKILTSIIVSAKKNG